MNRMIRQAVGALRKGKRKGCERCGEALRLLADPAPSPKKRTAAIGQSARKAAKSEKHRMSTKEIRAECMRRAEGRCEACGWGLEQNGVEMDHWLGGNGRKTQRQSVETCWMLCARCHWHRTHNMPDATHWNLAFAKHCGFWGYEFKPHVEHAQVPAPQAPGAVSGGEK